MPSQSWSHLITHASSSSEAGASFAALGVPHLLVEALAADGITSPFPIQTATLPDALAGRDVLGRGRTGSGKTLAFSLPLVARLAGEQHRGRRTPRALVLAPTRELATQIAAVLEPLAKAADLRVTTVFGGVAASRQITALRAGVDILVACPGRLEDLLRQRHLTLDDIRITVLDEADHMADLGFLPGVRRLLDATPAGSQRLLFSATLDRQVDVLVKRYLTNPRVHEVDSASSPVTAMSHHVLHVDRDHRLSVVADLAAAPGRTVVFTRTKRGARTLARQLSARGVSAVELHGDLAQNARTRNLAAFSDGRATALVATDIAARGIHVDGVTLVVHADPPVEHKAYLHRSGRTARAGEEGTVVTMMLDAQTGDVRDLMRKAGIKPTTSRVHADHPLLRQIAPGDRVIGAVTSQPARGAEAAPAGGRPRGKGRPASSQKNREAGGAPRSRRSSGNSSGGGSAPRADAPRRRTPTSSAPQTPQQHSAARFSSGLRGR